MERKVALGILEALKRGSSDEIASAIQEGQQALLDAEYLAERGHILRKTQEPDVNHTWMFTSEIARNQSNPVFAATPQGAIRKARLRREQEADLAAS